MLTTIRGWFGKAAVALSLVPAFVAGGAWSLGDKFLALCSDGYRRNAVVYACIRLLATAVPEAPLRVYRVSDRGEEVDNHHPLRLLIEQPNPYQSEFEFWELVVTQLSIGGVSYWWKERGNGGQPVALWPLRPDRCSPVLGRQTLLEGWSYNLDGQSYRLPAEDVLAFNYPDPGAETGGVVEGVGPLQVLAREVDADNEATSFVYAMLRNYAIPGTLIKTKAKLQQAEANRLKEQFRQRYGQMHRGEPAVIDGDTEVTTLAHSLQQLEFPELRALSETRIASAFGVPAVMVGLKAGLDRATYSNMAEAREYFAETTLAILWRRLSDQILLDLLPEFGRAGAGAGADVRPRFDTEHVKALQRQHSERAIRYEIGFKAGAVTVNEYRTLALGLPPLADAAGNVFVRPFNLLVVGVNEGPAIPATPAPPPPKALPAPAGWDGYLGKAPAPTTGGAQPTAAVSA